MKVRLVLGGVDEFLVAHHRHGDVAHEDEASAHRADDALDLEALLGEEFIDGIGDGDLGIHLGDAELGDLVLTGDRGELDGLDELGADVESNEVPSRHAGKSPLR